MTEIKTRNEKEYFRKKPKTPIKEVNVFQHFSKKQS